MEKRTLLMHFGDSVEINGFRVERWDDGHTIEDTANAGKRGKLCPRYAIRSLAHDRQQQIADADVFERALLPLLYSAPSGAAVQELAVRHGLDVRCGALRGVDVRPSNWQPVSARTDKVSITVDWDGFRIRDLCDPHNETTGIPSAARKATSIKKARDWASKHYDLGSAITGLTFWQVVDRMRSAGILVHTFCVVD